MSPKKKVVEKRRCGYAKCNALFTPVRRNQQFHTPKCRLSQFTEVTGTRRSWQATAEKLADVLREAVAHGLLPRTMEVRASAALRDAMPYKVPAISKPQTTKQQAAR